MAAGVAVDVVTESARNVALGPIWAGSFEAAGWGLGRNVSSRRLVGRRLAEWPRLCPRPAGGGK